MDRNRDFEGPRDDRAREAERLAAENAAYEEDAARERRPRDEDSADRKNIGSNPPHTTTGRITSPKFGSAGSGGAELDPGYPKN